MQIKYLITVSFLLCFPAQLLTLAVNKKESVELIPSVR